MACKRGEHSGGGIDSMVVCTAVAVAVVWLSRSKSIRGEDWFEAREYFQAQSGLND